MRPTPAGITFPAHPTDCRRLSVLPKLARGMQSLHSAPGWTGQGEAAPRGRAPPRLPPRTLFGTPTNAQGIPPKKPAHAGLQGEDQGRWHQREWFDNHPSHDAQAHLRQGFGQVSSAESRGRPRQQAELVIGQAAPSGDTQTATGTGTQDEPLRREGTRASKSALRGRQARETVRALSR